MPNDSRKPYHQPPAENPRHKDEILTSLTPREREVLKLIAKGFTNPDIAAKLFISKHTVKNHVSSIYRKLGVDDRTQVALLAIRRGLVSLDGEK